MNRYEWLDSYLLAKKGCAKDYKAEWGWQRYQVGGRLFAATCRPDLKHKGYDGRELLTLKCEPLDSELLRGEYPDIVPGFYMEKHNWISVFLDGAAPDELLRDLCDRSYALVFGKLTKKLQNEIERAAATGLDETLARLTVSDAAEACAFAASLTEESRESDRWYPYLDGFASLLSHKNSLVRNRALGILAANARWDTENRFEALLPAFLSHITDEKPITARRCIQALPELGGARPELIGRIREALAAADFSAYRDSMRPLLEKDAKDALQQLGETK